jgi:branched-chain amino acid transport system ATP-binding protein
MVTAILSLENIEVVYERVILAVRGVSLVVPEGKVVALLGANGAGKTTTLKAISNLVAAGRGQVTAGRVLYRGEEVTRHDPAALAAAGLVQVLEGRHCFPHLTVEENLRVGGFLHRPSEAQLRRELDRIYQLFPRLRERRTVRAGYTSGGEQQMVAIGRALMARPRLLLLDEPSMGLAPQIIEEIFAIVRELNRREGTSVLLAEQNAAVALAHADQAYIIENGRIVGEGTAAALAGREDVQAFYLGGGSSGTGEAGRDRPRRREFALGRL